jgi:hypothetical protein
VLERGAPADWAWKPSRSPDATHRDCCPGLGTKAYSLPLAYMEQAERDVALQLRRAGVRLAFVLNRALGTPP